MLAEFREHPDGGFRVQEGDMEAFSAFSGLLVDQPDAFGLGFLQASLQVIDSKGQMVDPFPTVSDEFADGSFRISGLQQFDFSLSDQEESGFYLLVLHFFNVIAFEPEDILIERNGLFQASDRNSNVLNMRYFHFVKLIYI
jgi:hypothetical protein